MAAPRQALSQTHPARTNVLSVGLISVLILIVSLQIWLLSASVNTSLRGHTNIAWTAFYASLALFLAGAVALSYLPLPIRLPVVVKRVEPFTNAALAWRTLAISAVSLGLAFAVWFMWSAIAVKLNDAGFGLTKKPALLAYSYTGDPRLTAANSLRAHCLTLWQPAQLCGSHSDPSPACARNRLRGARP
jgi:Family of unknown function (DUF6755)